jgi:DNA-directed RNA polymerase subunit RPC12/RpoP
MSSQCVVCTAALPPSDSATPPRACFRCVGRVLGMLAEIEDMAATLDTSPHGSRDTGPRRPFYGPRIPIDLTVAAVLDFRTTPSADDHVRSLLGVLYGINAHVREQLGERPPVLVVLSGELRYLRSRITWCATREHFLDLFGDLVDLHRQLRMIARDDRPQPVGRCPAIIDRVRPCGARLEVWPDDPDIRCRVCGAHWDRIDYLELAGQVTAAKGPALLDRQALAHYSGRTVNTIRKHCRPAKYTAAGVALYDVAAAMDKLSAVATRQRDTPPAVVDTAP